MLRASAACSECGAPSVRGKRYCEKNLTDNAAARAAQKAPAAVRSEGHGTRILGPTELKKLILQDYFFAGLTASVQPGTNAGVRFANGKVLLVALVNTSGYSTAIQQKYQALFLTDSRLNLEGSDLRPGAYGCGFSSGKFHVMNLAADDVVSVPARRDDCSARFP